MNTYIRDKQLNLEKKLGEFVLDKYLRLPGVERRKHSLVQTVF